ncbi:hypothetical protein O181_130064 [Austropuccinia psidii MF-1]|uniref:Uncharacterized protein n=1 Tax=Austropuccinia psidii MF-1 TaxID=1389203 RepID=A0A9Q3L341_9BASI|nr:hypothetical protein [Austropuccinia psidii MF-1]
MVHGDPWPNLGPMGLVANLVSKRFLAKIGSKELVAKIGSGGSNCGLGPTWLPPFATFGLIGLGQKGPNWPTDGGPQTTNQGPWAVKRRGPKWPKYAI